MFQPNGPPYKLIFLTEQQQIKTTDAFVPGLDGETDDGGVESVVAARHVLERLQCGQFLNMYKMFSSERNTRLKNNYRN